MFFTTFKEPRMTRRNDSTTLEQLTELLIADGPDAMAAALTTLLNHAMRIEREQILGAASHERTDARRGYANGYKPKTLTTRIGELPLQVPQTRDYADEHGRPFYPSALERGVRSERALTLAIAEMYVQGVSTRKVTQVMEQLCGLDVTSTQVSRAAAELDEQLEAWRNRPLGEVRYLILDARYEKVRHGGSVVPCALLTAIGVLADGKRCVLGCSVSLSEAEVYWREFIQSLTDRGMHKVKLVVSDDHAGLNAARQATLPGVPWQRCQFHLMQNAMAYVPRQSMKSEVAQDLRRVFNADDRAEAERRLAQLVDKHRDTAPRLADWLEENVPEGLTVFAFPAAHRKRLRTTNGLERLNKEIKRRTRVATLFPNEASLLRLASAVLSEISDEWETAKIYLNMNAQ
jgi:transposase-like protein